MEMRLLLATRNAHKIGEISSMLRGLPVRTAALRDFPGAPDVVEDGRTLEENAVKKAAQCAKATGLWCLADDTGLEVAALAGAPGVHSARYAGPGCDYEANNRKLLAELRGLPLNERRAVFRCVVALASPGGRTAIEEGRLEGLITESPRGENGFGYDPVFLLESRGKTLAELAPEEKNEVSHRASALRRMRGIIETVEASGRMP